MVLRILILAFLAALALPLSAAERAVILDTKTGAVPLRQIPQLDLEQHTIAAVDSRIAGLTASDATKKLFSSVNHATGTYVRSNTCWAAGLDLTGAAVYNSQFSGGTIGVTAITPRHVVSPHHAGGTGVTGGTVRFVNTDGTTVTRTVVAHAQVGTSDIEVGLLDSDLPANIKPLRLMPANGADVMSLVGLSILILDQEGKALVYDTTVADGGQFTATASTNAQRAAFYEALVTGDSGFPWFAIFDGEPLLLSTTSTAAPGAGGPIFSENISAVNAALTTLGGGYQVSTKALPEQIIHWRHVAGTPAITGKVASTTPTAGQVPLVQIDGKLQASLIPAGVGLTGSIGGNGSADSGKAAIFNSEGGLSAGASSDYGVISGSNTKTTGSTSYCAGVYGQGNIVGLLGAGTAVGAIGVHGTGTGLGLVANTSSSGNIAELRVNDVAKLTFSNNGALSWSVAQAKTDTRANLGLGSMATQSAGAVAITGGTAQLGALTLASDIILTDNGSSRDIRLTGNTGYIRFMATPSIAGAPAGASMQFFGNSAALPGQIYIDSGADNNAAIFFRTSGTGGAATERMRIAADGKISIAQFLHLSPQAAPGSPAEGDVYAGTDHHLYFYNGTAWKQLDN